MRDRESIELGFGPTCWHRLSAAAGPAGQVAASLPAAPLGDPTSTPVRPRVPTAVPGGDDTAGAALSAAPGPRRRAAPAAAVVGWLVVVAALLALVEYWRWVLVGLTVLIGLAALGVLLEWLEERRHRGHRSIDPH